MTRTEIDRRLADAPQTGIDRVRRMALEGYGAHGAALESSLSRKQVNAVFAQVETDRAARALPFNPNGV